MKELGKLPGGTRRSHARDINGSGQVVGYSGKRAFLYEGGTMKSLGTLPGGTDSYALSYALAVNDPGQVVGSSTTLLATGETEFRPFLYRSGTMKDLGTLPGTISSQANDVNDSGQVVGRSTNSLGFARGFLYSDCQMKDLNDLIPADSGWRIRDAMDLNNNGQILGLGVFNGTSTSKYVLLTPDAPPDADTPCDTTAPTVTATTPANAATGVARNTPLTATFSEKMDNTTIDETTFKLFKVASTGTTRVTNVTVRLSSNGLKATLDPFGTTTTLLAKNTKYRAVVTTGAKDLSGIALDQSSSRASSQQKAWTFTTGAN